MRLGERSALACRSRATSHKTSKTGIASLLLLRIFPAIHVTLSATRREELLYHPDELERIHILRKRLADLPAAEAMESLLDNLKATKTNTELLLAGLR